jgi:hypothetical protein
MSKKVGFWVMSLMAAFVLSAGLMAQEKTEVSIQVKKDGKVVKDTTYTYDDAAEAKHVWKMVEVMSGMDVDMDKGHQNYTMAHSDGKHASTMVFISEDGDKTKIMEMHGDSLTWVSEGEEPHGEHVMVMKEGDDETFDIWVSDEGEELEGKNHVKVIVSGDEKGKWHAVSTDDLDMDEDEKMYFISEDDDVKVELRKITEETGDGETVKVIVVKKERREEDQDKNVEVKVVKKKNTVEMK